MEACPCCGYRTLEFRNAYLGCPICLWTDDGLDPREESEQNEGLSLLEAQDLFLRHG